MNSKIKDYYKIAFIRGATTASGNSAKEIEFAVVELINELISRNNLIKTNIFSIIFTATHESNQSHNLIRIIFLIRSLE